MKKLLSQFGVDGGRSEAGARRGSALLITLLLLGILMTLALGVSSLVIREIVVTQSVVDANKAYYAAEAGVEHALLGLNRKLAGYEPVGEFSPPSENDNGGSGSGGGEANPALASQTVRAVDPDYAFSYSTSNKTDAVPGFPDDEPIFVEQVAVSGEGGSLVADCRPAGARTPFALALNKQQFYEQCPRATYRKLGLNETHIIPLFSTDDSGQPQNVNDFLVQYYLNVRDGSQFYGALKDLRLESFDVLRWKLYGKPLVDSGVQRTESIADFYPGVTNNGPLSPVCIGTDATIRAVTTNVISGAQGESCIFPSLSKKPPAAEDVDLAADLNDVTLWSAARECYMTDAGLGVTGGALIKGTTVGDPTGCQMRDFIDSHRENYLILTNMVNPTVLGVANLKDPDQLARADIYYRVLARKPEPGADPASVPRLVKDFAEISSFGSSAAGRAVKSLSVRYKAPGFLPVFNFSLYKTRDNAPELPE